jgi:hypothetical protein
MSKVKKVYKIGDHAWVYGVSSGAGYNKPVKGTVVHTCEIDGYPGTQYVIAVPTGIDDLLEVRSWESISQDAKGPVGSFREQVINKPGTQKMLSRVGLVMPDVELNPELEDDETNDH